MNSWSERILFAEKVGKETEVGDGKIERETVHQPTIEHYSLFHRTHENGD
jgi:hypothetical protein